MMKKILNIFILFVAIFFTTYNVFALEYVTNKTPKIDLNNKTSLKIEFKTTENLPLSETSFSIYKVADIDDNSHMIPIAIYKTLVTDFNSYSEIEWQSLSESFINYIDNNKIEPTKSGITDRRGIVDFGECEKGLYLVRGVAHVEETKLYTPINYFLTLPSLVNNVWVYDVNSNPKYNLDDYDNLINIEIIKVWNDKDYENKRPEEITISLLRANKDSDDYKQYKEVNLNASNNWTFTWNNLDNAYDYLVEEINVNDNYKVDIKREGNTFIITNTYIDNSPHLPQTGQLWWPVPILLGSGLILIALSILVNHSKKDKQNNEK